VACGGFIQYRRIGKKTGKLTTDKKRWAKRPHKLDFKGMDTSGSCPIPKVTAKPKKATPRKSILTKKVTAAKPAALNNWNFVDQAHPDAMHMFQGIIVNGEKYSKEDRIKWLKMEIENVKGGLKNVRAEEPNIYGVQWANKNRQIMKMRKVNALLDEKKKLNSFLDSERGKKRVSTKPKVQYFSTKDGSISNRKRTQYYMKVTENVYPIYDTSTGKKFYTGYKNYKSFNYKQLPNIVHE